MITIEQKKEMAYPVKSAGKFSVKDIDTSKRIVTGFFNAYNYFDSDMDVLIMGAAKKSIAERGPESQATAKIKHALNHNLNMLVGNIQVLKEATIDGITGIYFESKLANTTLGNDTLINYQEGIYDNHSIGFRYLDLERIEKGSGAWSLWLPKLINPEDADKAGVMYIVKEIKLYEGSTVAFGANQLTPYLGSKSLEGTQLKAIHTIELLEKQLRDGTQSDEMLMNFELQLIQLKQVIKEIEPSIKDTLKNEPSIDTQKFDIQNYLQTNKIL